jgi:hypothetical protein
MMVLSATMNGVRVRVIRPYRDSNYVTLQVGAGPLSGLYTTEYTVADALAAAQAFLGMR